MRRFLLIIFIGFTWTALGQHTPFSSPALMAALMRRAAATAPPAYSIEENCEGTGTPSGWTDADAPDWDYTTTPLQGSQSLHMTLSDVTYKDFTGANSLDCYALLRIATMPASTQTVFGTRSSNGATAICVMRLANDGSVYCYANGAAGTAAVTKMTTGTTYHVWIHWENGGTCSVGFSTDGIRPTTGNNYCTQTGGTTNPGRFYAYGAGNDDIELDRMLVLVGGTIGNSP